MIAAASVVLAEDEPLIRMMSAMALREEGFEVLEAEHAGTALDILKARACTVHLLFTDVQMPGPMDGVELAHHTSCSWPWIALLLVSARALDRPAPAGSRFLSKPYEHAHVVGHIRELLEPRLRG